VAEYLGRWLRAVRPATRADKDAWAQSPEADELLASVHRSINARPDGRPSWTWPGRRVWLPAGTLAAVALVTVVTLAVSSNSGDPAPTLAGPLGQAPRLPAVRPAAMLLSSSASCPDLLAGLRNHAAASVGPYGLPGGGLVEFRADDAAMPQAMKATSGSTANTDTSPTNNQEAGVDEPDLVKTDGDRVITLTDGVLRVLDARTRKVSGSLDLTSYVGAQGAQLLVDGDHALVILAADNSRIGYRFGPAMAMQLRGNGVAMSTYLSVDLSATPRIVGSLRASGSTLDARQVGSTVRIVVSSSPTITFPSTTGSTTADSTAVNRKIIQQAPLATWLPRYTLTNGAQSTSGTVPCQAVSHPSAYSGASMLTIYTVDLLHPGAGPSPVSVAADGDTVYATSSSLYIASHPAAACCSTTQTSDDTQIHRFDITGSAPPAYLGSGSVPGQLLSQYSLSAYAGSLRLATTQSLPAGTVSSVYVLDADTLRVSGHVTGLGQGEQLYAVRFLGPLAYVVTFRQTDPLFVVDLRNPRAPAVVGKLELTGYSDYLHDAGGGRLIGVGQEASTSGRVAGLQVSLFDMTKPAQPARTGHVVRTEAPGETALDPHAFLYWQPTGLMVVPIQSWQPSQSGKVLVLHVSGKTLSTVGLLANPSSTTLPDDGLGIQRSLLVHGNLWTVSGTGVQVSNLSTLARQTWVPFQ
jgi:hypothetical protein